MAGLRLPRAGVQHRSARARAAQYQGKFWEYHDVLYQNQGSINGGTFSDEKLIELAEEVGWTPRASSPT